MDTFQPIVGRKKLGELGQLTWHVRSPITMLDMTTENWGNSPSISDTMMGCQNFFCSSSLICSSSDSARTVVVVGACSQSSYDHERAGCQVELSGNVGCRLCVKRVRLSVQMLQKGSFAVTFNFIMFSQSLNIFSLVGRLLLMLLLLLLVSRVYVQDLTVPNVNLSAVEMLPVALLLLLAMNASVPDCNLVSCAESVAGAVCALLLT